MKFDAEDQDAVDAERGYAVRGEREVRLREWFSVREAGEKPRDFKRLVWRLQQRRVWAKKAPEKKAKIYDYRRAWAKRNKERVLECAREHKRKRRAAKIGWAKDEVAKKRAVRAIASQKRRAELVYTCVVCGAQWCKLGRIPPRPPKYCSQACDSRAGYLRAKAAGKR